MGTTSSFNSGKTYTKIASYTVSGGSTDSFTISNIPQGFTDLVIVTNGSQTGGSNAAVRFNGDSGSNYSNTWLFGNGTSPGSGRALSQTQIIYNFVNTTNNRSMARLNIMNYSSNSVNKTMIWRRDDTFNATITQVGLWRSTAAITSITFLQTVGSSYFTSGTTFNIYGIKAAMAPKAVGGTITTDGSYWIHTFTSSGLFIPQQSINNVDYLVVAGGGAGGGDRGGGGGAGGFRTSSLSLTAQNYTVTIGAGGSGVSGGSGNKGNNSVFGSIISTGGGLGTTNGGASPAGSGGSGGGGFGAATAGTANLGGSGNEGGYSPVEGYAGGEGQDEGARRGGGGGGASAAGATGTASGNGGDGTVSSISGSSVTYSGGGGGGSLSPNAAGTGGSGGGGNGVNSGSGNNGAANQGGGGGGAGSTGGTRQGGNGGSGIVIVRYPV